MGVKVRQKIKGIGNPWWVFISHNGKRASRKVGDKKAAEEVASTIRAKLQLGEFGFEDPKPVPTFKEYSEMWFALPHDWKESTRAAYQLNMDLHVLPVFHGRSHLLLADHDGRLDRRERGRVRGHRDGSP